MFKKPRYQLNPRAAYGRNSVTRLSCEWYTGWEGKGPGIEVTLAELRKGRKQEVGKTR